jgi:PKHD-type hydroxylase
MNLLLPPRYTIGSETHAYWEDFLTEEEILKLLSVKEWHEKQRGLIGVNQVNVSGDYIDKIRNSNVSWLTPTQETSIIWEKILDTITQVNRRYFHYDLTGCYEAAQLTSYHYSEQQHYSWHIDSGVSDCGVPRKLSMSLLLSDPSEFEGGDLQLKVVSDDPATVEQKRGRAWFFPSYMLHRVTPVTKGLRRSLVLWVGGPQFK